MRKTLFTAIGVLDTTKDGKRLRLKSPAHWQQQINKLVPGKMYAVTVSAQDTTRSHQQLAYYWVLMNYLADHTGYEPTELHDAIMRQKFGLMEVKVGRIVQHVRKSISDIAKFPKSDMVELISEVLALCAELGVRVPTKEELGYLEG